MKRRRTKLFSRSEQIRARRLGLEHENVPTHSAILRYTDLSTRSHVLGEFIDPISSAPFGLYGSLIGAAALGVFALVQGDTENDDDDSTPGGGLMQPIA
jgi:hypothetical protein